MSFYNLIFGENILSEVILATLGLTKRDCGRFRDCFIVDGKIAVYTRNGGANRENYQETIDKLAEHPFYLRDEDDDFDSTYCTIYFRFPDKFAEDLKKLDSEEKFNPSERWLKAIECIKNIKVTR